MYPESPHTRVHVVLTTADVNPLSPFPCKNTEAGKSYANLLKPYKFQGCTCVRGRMIPTHSTSQRCPHPHPGLCEHHTLQDKTGLAGVVRLRTWDGETMLDYPGGPCVITRVLCSVEKEEGRWVRPWGTALWERLDQPWLASETNGGQGSACTEPSETHVRLLSAGAVRVSVCCFSP